MRLSVAALVYTGAKDRLGETVCFQANALIGHLGRHDYYMALDWVDQLSPIFGDQRRPRPIQGPFGVILVESRVWFDD